MANLYVDIHVLQIIPPSCVNRDDTGSPKTAFFGGVPRARVSSQCWKNAIRNMFRDILPKEDIGIRTKHLIELISKEIRLNSDNITNEEGDKLADGVLKIIGEKGLTMDEKNPILNKTLFFISQAQVKSIAESLSKPDIKRGLELKLLKKGDSSKEKKAAKKASEDKEKEKEEKKLINEAENVISNALRIAPSIDIALFGRMVAEAPSLNTDACCQVAHSISTHKVNNEFDYFTAQDDCSPADNAGAGMIGTVEYNSSTLYRYATIAVHALKDNLEENTVEAVKAFVDAFIRAMPTGKINTFANRTLPSAVMVTIREDQPINLVGAFEKPVKSGDNGYVESSCKALVAHAKATYRDWLPEPRKCFVIGEGFKELGDAVTLKELLNRLGDELESLI